MRLIDLYDSFTLNECNGTGYSLAFGGSFIDVYDPKGKPICQFWGGDAPTIDPSSLRPKGEWISVLDRLPSENERVLACYINPLRKDRPPRMMVGEGTSTTLVKGKVYLWCGGWRSITHWMPLPEPPNTEAAHDS